MSSKYYRAYGESSAWLGMVKEPRLLAHHILVYFAITAKLPMAVGRHLFVDASRTFLLHLCLVRDILQNEPTIDEQKILLLRVLDLVQLKCIATNHQSRPRIPSLQQPCLDSHKFFNIMFDDAPFCFK
jgi:hypothetical protein